MVRVRHFRRSRGESCSHLTDTGYSPMDAKSNPTSSALMALSTSARDGCYSDESAYPICMGVLLIAFPFDYPSCSLVKTWRKVLV